MVYANYINYKLNKVLNNIFNPNKQLYLNLSCCHMVAVDMSKILLKNTKNDLMIWFAYRIIRAQQSEIIMLDNLRKSVYKYSSNLV